MISENKIKWAIFFSGGGRSANDFLTLVNSETYRDKNEVKLLVTAGQPNTLTGRAQKNSMKTIEEDVSKYSSKNAYQSWLSEQLKQNDIDYIFLLGYKYRIRKPLLSNFENRIFNTHPSILPAFKNTQRAIEDALQLGVKISGVTSHIIDENIDEGMIVSQEVVFIDERDTLKTLDPKFNLAGKKVLEKTLNFVEKNHSKSIYLSKLFVEKTNNS